jgi:hypothetical protein
MGVEAVGNFVELPHDKGEEMDLHKTEKDSSWNLHRSRRTRLLKMYSTGWT